VPDASEWNVSSFRQPVQLKITAASNNALEFDLIHVAAPIANALRRIMIAALPTMAIEHCYVLSNTSVMSDDVLAFRLGLVPIKVDPALFDWKRPGDPPTDRNTVVFKLQVRYPLPGEQLASTWTAVEDGAVYASMLKWEPKGGQAERFAMDPITITCPNILLMKLGPGQEIDVELHCEKGAGKVHAKWSPVATAFYRLLPEITLLDAIVGEEALRFQRLFPPGVIAVRKNKHGKRQAYVENARAYTMDREVLRHPEFQDRVRLSQRPDHFLFSIEATGALRPAEICLESIRLLRDKCVRLKRAVALALAGEEAGGVDGAEPGDSATKLAMDDA